MEPNYWLVVSSFSYCFPCYFYYRLGHSYLTMIYVGVITSSSLYHATKYPSLLWIDIPIAHLAHVSTLLQIWKGGWRSMVPYTFWLLYTLVTYYYGYKTSTLIWNPNIQQATPWHMGMHGLTSLMCCVTMYYATDFQTTTI